MFTHACKLGLEGIVSKMRGVDCSNPGESSSVEKTSSQRETPTIAGFAFDGNKRPGVRSAQGA